MDSPIDTFKCSAAGEETFDLQEWTNSMKWNEISYKTNAVCFQISAREITCRRVQRVSCCVCFDWEFQPETHAQHSEEPLEKEQFECFDTFGNEKQNSWSEKWGRSVGTDRRKRMNQRLGTEQLMADWQWKPRQNQWINDQDSEVNNHLQSCEPNIGSTNKQEAICRKGLHMTLCEDCSVSLRSKLLVVSQEKETKRLRRQMSADTCHWGTAERHLKS